VIPVIVVTSHLCIASRLATKHGALPCSMCSCPVAWRLPGDYLSRARSCVSTLFLSSLDRLLSGVAGFGNKKTAKDLPQTALSRSIEGYVESSVENDEQLGLGEEKFKVHCATCRVTYSAISAAISWQAAFSGPRWASQGFHSRGYASAKFSQTIQNLSKSIRYFPPQVPQVLSPAKNGEECLR